MCDEDDDIDVDFEEDEDKEPCDCTHCGSDDIETCGCAGSCCDCCNNCMNHCDCDECEECGANTDESEDCDTCGKGQLCPDCMSEHQCPPDEDEEDEDEEEDEPEPEPVKEKTLEELQPGDKVIEGYGNSARVQIIDRVTATQIVIGSTRYNRKHGRRCGKSQGWHSSSIHVANQESLDRCERERLIGSLANMRRDELNHLSLVQLREIHKIMVTK